MTDTAAFKATYSDFRLVKTRRCVQLVFEVPVEDADAALKAVGGMPDAGTERWFAIARLTNDTKKPPAVKKQWHEMTLTQQAGLLCEDVVFQKFLRETTEFTHADYPLMVRQMCGVESRKDILLGSPAGDEWKKIVSDYRAWQRTPEYVP